MNQSVILHERDHVIKKGNYPIFKKKTLQGTILPLLPTDAMDPDAKLDRIRKSYVIKQKTLILSTRGITYRYRHLMQDLLDLLPHAKKDSKLDTKQALWVLNEACDMKGCSNCIFFEVRKGTDLFMWFSKVPHGPSIKFHILNGMYTS